MRNDIMVQLSLSIPCPAFEIELLLQGKLIALLPKMYLKGKSFLLYPLDDHNPELFYHSEFSKNDVLIVPSEQSKITIQSWAKCELCERVQSNQSIEQLSQSTVWTYQGLTAYRGQQPHLFVAYLRVYRLLQPIEMDRIHDADDKFGKFMGLNQAIALTGSQPVLSEDQFEESVQRLNDRQPLMIRQNSSPSKPNVREPDAIAPIQPEPCEPIQAQTPPKPPPLPVPDIIPELINESASPYDLSKIADVGNSSEGHAFERLVRQGLLFLGFQNSGDNPKASLDPETTGGAGGLDFYADYPYAIVGECKATKTEKVPDGTPAQLVKLGHKILKDHYHDCIKLVVAAGELTNAANETASGNQINVLRPETIQRLVDLKRDYPGTINLFELKEILESEPFSEAVDAQINQYIDEIINDIQTRIHIINLVQQQHPTSVDVLKGFYLGRYGKVLDPTELHYILVELSSPLAGFLGRKKGKRWQDDQFYFVREFDRASP
jgi:hypothetical protein